MDLFGRPFMRGRRRAGPAARLIVLWGLLVAGSPLPAEAADDDPFQVLSLIRPAPSSSAPDFAVPGLAGPSLRLSDFKGRVVFLNFWATWCPPCKEEMPSMERLYRRFRERGFTMVAISIDANTPAVAPFVKRFGLTFPIGLDPKMEVATRYGLRALPTTVLIDRGGRMVAFAFGPRNWDGPAAHALVDGLLN